MLVKALRLFTSKKLRGQLITLEYVLESREPIVGVVLSCFETRFFELHALSVEEAGGERFCRSYWRSLVGVPKQLPVAEVSFSGRTALLIPMTWHPLKHE